MAWKYKDEVDELISKEFDSLPPERRAAEKLNKLGFTTEELWNRKNKTCLSDVIWLKTMNALKDIENDFIERR